MKNESRVQKSLMNAKVNLFYYFAFIILSFFSRKIFLDTLGPEFTGLQGTLQSILGYLNLAEFGISTAIAFNLYRPIKQGDKEKIRDLISLFGYLYRVIGIFVLITGIIVACFLPLIFRDSVFSNSIIILCYLAFFLSSLYGYFLNYKQILLTADQKAYIVTRYYQAAQFVAVLIQMAFAYYLRSYIGVILVQMSYGIVYCLIIENRLIKEYPWLKVDLSRGKQLLSEYPSIIKTTKQVFVHKIKDLILNKSDQLFIFTFSDLKMVAYYGNYSLVLIKIQQLITTSLDGLSASVGNLVAEGNPEKTNKVFWELISFRYYIAGVSVFCVCILIQPFIFLWLGEEYLLSRNVILLMVLNYYIMQTRGVVDMFNNAYGHYADVWSAWTEAIVNVCVTVVAGIKWGILGILIGKLVSMTPIVILWKPYYLYRDGFKISYWKYWKGILVHYAVWGISIIASYFLVKLLFLNPYLGVFQFMFYACFCFIIFVSFYTFLVVLFAPGAKDLLLRIPFFKRKHIKFWH